MKFKIALLQMNSLNRQYQESTEIVLAKMREAAAEGADLLLLPEVFLTGYVLPFHNQEALGEDNPYLQQICAAAGEIGIGVVATAVTRGREKPQNSAYVIDKQGRRLMKYSKVHTCDFADEACFESGDAFHVCDFHGIRLGVMICYDREYQD